MISAAVMCLAMAVHFEARGEPLEGQYAVAQVIMHRVESKSYPNTVCDVVKQGAGKGLNRCHFSFYCDGLSDEIKNEAERNRAIAVANTVIYSRRMLDYSGQATHYYAHNITVPYWAHSERMRHTATIENHTFMREERHGSK